MLILQDSTMNVLCRIIQENVYNIKHFMLVTNNLALFLTRRHIRSDDLQDRETNSATPHFSHHTRTETSSDKSLHPKFCLCHNFCKLLETPTRPLPLSTCHEPVTVTASTPSHPGRCQIPCFKGSFNEPHLLWQKLRYQTPQQPTCSQLPTKNQS